MRSGVAMRTTHRHPGDSNGQIVDAASTVRRPRRPNVLTVPIDGDDCIPTDGEEMSIRDLTVPLSECVRNGNIVMSAPFR